jgi:hypothetical protein
MPRVHRPQRGRWGEGIVTAALIALLCAATVVLAWREAQLTAGIRNAQREILRAQIRMEEAERCRLSLKQLAAAQEITEVAVDYGTQAVRAVHRGIASIPFTILEKVPVVRGPARLVRVLHDSIAGGVYGTITGVNQAVGAGMRRQLKVPEPRALPTKPKP